MIVLINKSLKVNLKEENRFFLIFKFGFNIDLKSMGQNENFSAVCCFFVKINNFQVIKQNYFELFHHLNSEQEHNHF